MNAIDQTIAANLERARLELAEAEKTHADAIARVDAIQARIETIVVRQAEITAKRLDGTATAEETAELVALDHDEIALGQILQKAQTDAEGLVPDAARNKLASAEAAWRTHEGEVRVSALLARARVIEANLTACLGELADAARIAGHAHFREVWAPSPELETCFMHSRLETVSAIRRAA